MAGNNDLRAALTGISGILVTPYDSDGTVAPTRLRPIVDRCVEAGVHALVTNGNTGEFYCLTYDEAERMIRGSAEIIDGRMPLIAGVGRSGKEAAALARASKIAGADAIMIQSPPDPFVSPRGVLAYVTEVAEAADGLPLLLYNRNDALDVETIAALCGVEGVIGVKWATPNVLKLAACIEQVGDRVAWIGGLAEVWAPPLCAVGARGFTSGLINVWPEHSVAIHNALEQGDYNAAAKMIALMRPFEEVRAEEGNGANVSGVKAALALLGHDCGPARPPAAWPLSEAQHNRLSAFVANAAIPTYQHQ
ncbi:dihydrodipicolinate synthase family protein [Notoacmeibacter sp. MSK16QG-6]|uniref:dihydrodipicolinate synthase family protein n=1 Tax=Notoacmeibacter sp. MSK16QG-6 TaxID=2957982 RepID=UPI00209E35F7|nr:dihydrodipicolinate synthase family protein [Notoacmeibacter sp. MSK16QG-6]MCP1199545.1 dihydrodipicolinate synthase family protein [Notoacmeibacter sp. MSK16QG-6]